MMLISNLKHTLIIIAETLFVIGIGILLMMLNFPSWINCIFYICLLAEIIWILKLSNKIPTSNYVAVLSFVILGISLISMIIIKDTKAISLPYVIIASYELYMGYLALSGFLIISKNSKNDNQSKKTKRIGLFLFCLSTIISILSLFGLAE